MKPIEINRSTRFAFACLAGLASLVLAIGSDGSVAAWAAFSTIVFGYFAVDLLRLFSLPAAAAYPLMAVVVAYCVSDFLDWEKPGNHQMVVVAQLLGLVQAILMLQKKSQRLLEQVATFSLLQLVVAAVFNNALSFGILLLPIGVAAVYALTALAVMHLSDTAQMVQAPGVRMRSELASPNWRWSQRRVPRMILMTLAPATALVAAVFFYALPRTTKATPSQDAGASAVGFSDEISLNAIQSTLSNPQIALRVQLSLNNQQQPYVTSGPVYLRGRVLDEYDLRTVRGRPQAEWRAIAPPAGEIRAQLPPAFIPIEDSERKRFDEVTMRVTAESSRSKSLFITTPAYQNESNRTTKYIRNRMTLTQRIGEATVYPRLIYDFLTHAFYRGEQTRWTAMPDRLILDEDRPRLDRQLQRASEDYIRELIRFDGDQMPSIEDLADSYSRTASGRKRDAYEIATALEVHFATSPNYRYSLQPDMNVPAGIDPIEHFVATSRRGHCQYFSTALAMALRSQDIPARLVIGYSTDEFHKLSGRLIARGTHAHVWVEALIAAEELPANAQIAGQAKATHYWYRLDPTPGIRQNDSGSNGVGQAIDLAQNAWDDYVVEMDSDRQSDLIVGAGIRNNVMHRSYVSLVQSAGSWLRDLRDGDADDETLAGNRFSGAAAALTFFGLLVTAALLRMRWTARRRRRKSAQSHQAEQPKLAFFQQASEHLAAIGLHRSAAQTPAEWVTDIQQQWQHPVVAPASPALAILSDWYYRLRFGRTPALPIIRPDTGQPDDPEAAIPAQAKREIDEALASLRESCERYGESLAGDPAPNSIRSETSQANRA